MKGVKQNMIVVLIVTAGTLIWVFKGSEAKQKWVFKIKNKYDNRKQLAQNKQIVRNGGVLLDDIEMAAYHK